MAGIYIHIPFCKQACYYCDFHFSTSLKKKDALILALVKELEIQEKELQNHTVETIYFGGGTPSLLSNTELNVLIEAVYANYKVVEKPEITLEANPDDLTGNRIQELAKSPINRLSIGIQSFFEDDLKIMNRAHNANEAKSCLEEATRYFDNITIDLIYGIPNMSLEQWDANLEQALNFGVNHISSYALTVEPKTALDTFVKKGTFPPIDEDLALQHFNHLVKRTEEAGFIHYEISNFGKPHYFSKHNTSYWQGKPYLGIGPSAHSFLGHERRWNVSNNIKYIEAIETGVLPNTSEVLSREDQFNEYILTGLRTIWGVSLNRVEAEFGTDFLQHLKKHSQEFIKDSLLRVVEEFDDSNTLTQRLTATQKGKFLIDGIASELFMI
ncbi:radical SAM family heme chaperone HemW [Tamlana sp. 2_MG-2023]|uniref:radical SAM family heme chaperone HemW n=1 Tax=unclassified Tamlana TaxID=2614803 RepID=UPI0026E17D82|nr:MULTISPECIES: radical SAM family heme chaperone HemW [unclassified Tamlana]MDO6761774.1 radical SAM family heme chaperone HemW [Tamlana sp. 2_MG-2023]MDO6792535.1 radical SAM family heme chaperone HemW [Tamlana sp. 1_MG-2023]